MESHKSVAIVGAGTAGLICARQLAAAGYAVSLFDKSRGVGGRMATRRGEGDAQFDHGAQYFTAQDERFSKIVQSWLAAAVVAPWQGRIVKLQSCRATPTDGNIVRYVGQPTMNALAKHLADGLNIATQSLVQSLNRVGQQWMLRLADDAQAGPFDVVLLNVPAPQAAPLLPANCPWRARVAEVQMHGCWAVMAQFNEPLPLPYDGAFIADSPLSWVARNNSKPGRPTAECWVLHGSPAWSDAHLELAPEAARDLLLDAFRQCTGNAAGEPITAVAHRWRYAQPASPLEQNCLFDEGLALGVCGDWCGGTKIESAALSGLTLAERVLKYDRGSEH